MSILKVLKEGFKKAKPVKTNVDLNMTESVLSADFTKRMNKVADTMVKEAPVPKAKTPQEAVRERVAQQVEESDVQGLMSIENLLDDLDAEEIMRRLSAKPRSAPKKASAEEDALAAKRFAEDKANAAQAEKDFKLSQGTLDQDELSLLLSEADVPQSARDRIKAAIEAKKATAPDAEAKEVISQKDLDDLGL